MPGRGLKRNGPWVEEVMWSHKMLKFHSWRELWRKGKVGDRQHDFCIDIWFLIITSKRRSVLIVLQPGLHRGEGICCQSLSWGVGRSWRQARHRISLSLGPKCSQVEHGSGCLGSDWGLRGNPSLPEHGR